MNIQEIRVTLLNIEPEISRVLLVPDTLRLDRLHATLQAAMGWENSHLYMFLAGDSTWGMPGMGFDDDDLPADKSTLAKAAKAAGAAPLIYVYDMGDSWEHLIELGETREPEAGEVYPKLTQVTGNCPPEDVGGFPGYYEFLNAMSDPKHPEHQDLMDWHGGPYDPAAPDTEALTSMVKRLANRWKPRKRK